MFSFLERLRQKSEGERRLYALLLVSFVTGIIFVIWIVNLVTHLSRLQVLEESRVEEVADGGIPFRSLMKEAEYLFVSGMEKIQSFQGPIEYEQEKNPPAVSATVSE